MMNSRGTHPTQPVRCVIYPRKSSEEGLEQSFNSLDAQREACEAYIKSQLHEGWVLDATRYDDGGFSGGSMKRPALQQLMQDIEAGKVDLIVVYKVDRLSRSLADFSKMVEAFDQYGVSFVSITQQFNTSTSMGRLTLNVLLSFAQFEREVTGERIRDKLAASKKKGMWIGGPVPLGYDVQERELVVNQDEADRVDHIYRRYLDLGSVKLLKEELDRKGIASKSTRKQPTGRPFSRGSLYTLLRNPLYIGRIAHQGTLYPGRHSAIVAKPLWKAVQKKLSENRHRKRLRTAAKEPSLLAGLLFDERGHPFSPSHSRKKSRRYRYYVNQAVIQFKQAPPDTLIRIPAQVVETLVENQVIKLMRNPGQLLAALSSFDLSAPEKQALVEQAAIFSREWDRLTTHQKIENLTLTIEKLTLSRTELTLHFSPAGLLQVLLPEVLDQEREAIAPSLVVRVTVALKRCGVETKLIVEQPGLQHEQRTHPDSLRAIQEAVKCALLWNHALVTGAARSTTDLAEQSGVSLRYISQLIPLAWLSPTIVERIFRGDIPHDLTLGRLKQNIPLSWKEQKTLFS